MLLSIGLGAVGVEGKWGFNFISVTVEVNGYRRLDWGLSCGTLPIAETAWGCVRAWICPSRSEIPRISVNKVARV